MNFFEDVNESEVISEEDKKREDYRENIVKEIIQTETSYVESLNNCITFYMEKMKSGKIIPEKDVTTLFLYFDQVHTVNKSFLHELEVSKIETCLRNAIGKIFLHYIPYFKVYTQYIGNSKESLKLLKEYDSNKTMSNYLEKLRNELPLEVKLDLRSYLIMVCYFY